MVAISMTRGLDLEALLIQRLEANRLRLPPYPAVALKLQRLSRAARCSTQELSNTIAVDAALVAAVLQRANAAASGPVREIATLDAAVGRLGVEHLLRLALAHGIGTIANASGPLSLLRRDVWRRSLLAARIAQELAVARSLDAGEAFVAGLLHDFGAISVLAGLEDLNVELPVLPAESWRSFVDRLQVQFGAALAQRWGLPTKITQAIRYHRCPDAYAGPDKPLVSLVATAVRAVDVLDRAPETGVAALLEVPTLGVSERYQIGIIAREIAELLEAFEPTRPDEPAAAVAPRVAIEGGWPIHFVVACKATTYDACALSPDTVMFRGNAPLAPNWLASLVLQCEPDPISMLANVITCEPVGDGTYTIAARPFALDGPDKQLWFALIARTRPAR